MVYVCCVRLSEALTEPVIRHNFTKIPLPSKSFVFSQKLIQFYEVVLVYLNRTARSRKLRHSHSLTVLLREQTALICFTDVVTPSWSEANGSLDLTLLTNFLWVILKRGWLSYLRARAYCLYWGEYFKLQGQVEKLSFPSTLISLTAGKIVGGACSLSGVVLITPLLPIIFNKFSRFQKLEESKQITQCCPRE